MLKEVMDIVSLHLQRAGAHYAELKGFDLDEDIFIDHNKVKTVDAFLFRFIKLQDYMGEKLFRELLRSLGEYKENMSLLDVLDKLEKLEIIDSSDRWMEMRSIRNDVTHEYPENSDEILDGIESAVNCFPEIEGVVASINSYVKERKLG